MNRKEYLLDCLMEEAAEVQQAASKCLRFGFDAYNPKDTEHVKNATTLQMELKDLIAVASMLAKDGYIDFKSLLDEVALKNKIDKIERYMNISNKCGTLID